MPWHTPQPLLRMLPRVPAPLRAQQLLLAQLRCPIELWGPVVAHLLHLQQCLPLLQPLLVQRCLLARLSLQVPPCNQTLLILLLQPLRLAQLLQCHQQPQQHPVPRPQSGRRQPAQPSHLEAQLLLG